MFLDPLVALSGSSPFNPSLSLNKEGCKENHMLLDQHCMGYAYPKVNGDFLTLLEAIVHMSDWGLIFLRQLLVSFN